MTASDRATTTPGNEASRSEGSRSEIEASLRRFFAERSGGALSADAIDPSVHLFNSGYLDSMSSLSLLDFIDERYGVTVPELDLVGPLCTLAGLADFVAERSIARP
jgi:acyl carrier protein